MIKPTNSASSSAMAEINEALPPGFKGGQNMNTSNQGNGVARSAQNSVKERSGTASYRNSTGMMHENIERSPRTSNEAEPKSSAHERRPIKLLNQLPSIANSSFNLPIQPGSFFMVQGNGNGGSQIRKRNRIGHEDLLSDGEEEEGEKRFGMDELLQKLNSQIEAIFKKGERGRSMFNKSVLMDTFQKMCLEDSRRNTTWMNMSNKLIECQEERNVLQKQVLECQL